MGGGFERCRAVIIDLAAAGKTRNIPETLQSFKRLCRVKVICFHKDGSLADNIVQSLIDAGFYNVILSSEPGDIAREWSECLCGRTEREARTGKRDEREAGPRRIYDFNNRLRKKPPCTAARRLKI